ncbi:N-6 DNA methylase [uncultured Tateyamaria sp.]|uniref:N-6 DNA methylase n=1 Tax=uncultured Tateyamaria sp. TaxID=455651 RepID=UPI00261D41F9|nr:N-6 DNA methylase [uncultured Tateyamaria sp.]
MVQAVEVSRKKELGAFYTHSGLSDTICAWAITSPDSTVLEPSFGGCGFLRSARDRLVSIGSETSLSQLYGCDIDADAFLHLASVFERLVDLEKFHEGDFLDQNFPETWPKSFGSVVGNPPYIPYRKIPVEQRERVLKQLSVLGLDLDRRASLWAYFTALSVPYTETGGRAAWVLPSSFLYANYSRKLRSFIANNFDETRAFELKERQFLLEGTEEKTVVVLCKGKLNQAQDDAANDIPLERCDGVKDLPAAIQRWDIGKSEAVSYCGTSIIDSLSHSPSNLVKRLQSQTSCRKLGEFLDVKIGLVTGNNRFFLLNEDEREELNIRPCELGRVLPRFHFASGLTYSEVDQTELLQSDGNGYLVSADDPNCVSDNVKSYLARYDEEQIASCSTFKKRSIWCKTDDCAPPDAFFPVMQHHGPKLVLNESGYNCTNSIHRAYFKANLRKTDKMLISLSLLSTFSQISAEIFGRSYGSGALKHEPREAEKIEILIPKLHHRTVGAAFNRVDRMLRNGNLAEARQFVDLLLLSALELEDVPTQAALMNSGLEQLKSHRHR